MEKKTNALVTINEAAKLLSVSRRTVTRWAEDSAFPIVRLSSRALRIRVSDLEEFIRSRTIQKR